LLVTSLDEVAADVFPLPFPSLTLLVEEGALECEASGVDVADSGSGMGPASGALRLDAARLESNVPVPALSPPMLVLSGGGNMRGPANPNSDGFVMAAICACASNMSVLGSIPASWSAAASP